VPQGTGKSHQNEYGEPRMQDIHGGIFVSIQDESTMWAEMGTNGEALLHPCATP